MPPNERSGRRRRRTQSARIPCRPRCQQLFLMQGKLVTAGPNLYTDARIAPRLFSNEREYATRV